MLVLLSPAKTIKETVSDVRCKTSLPETLVKSQELLEVLQGHNLAALQKTLGVSAALARQDSDCTALDIMLDVQSLPSCKVPTEHSSSAA